MRLDTWNATFLLMTCLLRLSNSLQAQFFASRSTFLSSTFFRRGNVGSSSSTQLFSGQPDTVSEQEVVPLYRCEGLFAVNKPLDWTSNDVVSYIRGILERDARNRGAKPVNVRSRRNKSRIIRVGHGGTLDPLASGVLVIGVGKGTKELQQSTTTVLERTKQGQFVLDDCIAKPEWSADKIYSEIERINELRAASY